MASVIAVIPTRMGSTRFPGKALAAETGRPLVLHVADAVARSSRVDRIVVASEDSAIEAACRAAGVDHVMTAATHPNGSSRMAEAAADLDADVFLNVQGDEPEIDAGTIDATVDALVATPDAGVATAATPLKRGADHDNPNIVKVVTALDGTALYFSRTPIPHGDDTPLRHIGIYAFRPDVLARYPGLEPTPLEQSERLEQLRLLEHGIGIAVARVPTGHGGIDTPEQYAAFVDRWRTNHPD
ncbi:MAG: 3-deoxy-manno-octulosonate cytidylyltransferase [Phycisphaerales bacterium]|jgi:3-deoxy-manno-octulosonate cytidylyltransferase (CMP-KDO synthetase)|nr:3-deoxy-manno-octulosonate cytidylyltransferase [Phycisphaerales bacterium]